MPLLITLSFVAAALCLALGLAAIWLKRRSWPWMAFAFGSLLLAADAVCAGLILSATPETNVAFYYQLRLLALAFLPGTWLAVSLSYSRGNYGEFIGKWRTLLLVSLAIPLATWLLLRSHLAGNVSFSEAGHFTFIPLGVGGKLLSFYVLLSSIVILMNFERTFRSAVGVMRWRIKFFVIGAALLFGSNLYESSQALLYSGVHALSLKIRVLAILLGSIFIAYSFLRTRLGESEIYPSHKVLQHSITFALAVAYLVCVGLFANLVTWFGGDPIFPIKAFLLMLAIVSVTLVILSDRVRQQIALFVSRNFRRPMHDYRKIWALFTERTGSLIDRTEFCRAVVHLISETFELLSVTLWMVNEREKTLAFGASTALTEQKAENLKVSHGELDQLLRSARLWKGPVDMDASQEECMRCFQQLNPDHFQKGGNRVCIPLLSAGEVLGFITVADRVSGRRFSFEDLDLLKCLGDEVAGRLRNIELSRQLLQNKEIEAFQTMSAFFVHDLKNTASTLSLMLQNLSIHFGDPVFREDCQRSLLRSVTHIKDLINRLSLLRHELKINKRETDLNAVIASTLADLNATGEFEVVRDLQPLPKILADADQVQKVVTNLLLNAREAGNGSAGIRVQTGRDDGWVMFSVTDTGCGMTEEFVRKSLFKAFQTTKKSGLGIGLFHSKAIVEAHQGHIEVQSEVGKGTTFRVLFPI